jgi:carboxymethylenebutenolidase
MTTAVPRISPTRTELTVASEVLTLAEIQLPGVPRGAVILLCDPDALDEQAVDLMNGLAEHGYESLVTSIGGAGLANVSDPDALAIVQALLGRLANRGWDPEQVGMVGFGFGGRVALRAAAESGLGAAVSVSPNGMIHGTGHQPALIDDAQPVTTPWLGMFGELDPGAPRDAIQVLAERLTEPSPAYTELVTYPGVADDFFRDSAEALGHAAMFDSWQRIVEWLNLRVVPRPTPYAEIWSLKQAMSG